MRPRGHSHADRQRDADRVAEVPVRLLRPPIVGPPDRSIGIAGSTPFDVDAHAPPGAGRPGTISGVGPRSEWARDGRGGRRMGAKSGSTAVTRGQQQSLLTARRLEATMGIEPMYRACSTST